MLANALFILFLHIFHERSGNLPGFSATICHEPKSQMISNAKNVTATPSRCTLGPALGETETAAPLQRGWHATTTINNFLSRLAVLHVSKKGKPNIWKSRSPFVSPILKVLESSFSNLDIVCHHVSPGT